MHLLREVTDAVRAEECQLAVLVPPATMKHVEQIAGNLEKMPPKSTYFLCAAEGAVPGDCGEGVHFAGGVAYSAIRDNFIADNSGGVLLTDDIGPTHNNVVQGNVVTDNVADCGITVPGHNPNALNSSGVPQPSVAGVYRNAILGNVVTGNGVKGFGAGVLFATPTPGTASYDNLVQGNYIAGNGLAGDGLPFSPKHVTGVNPAAKAAVSTSARSTVARIITVPPTWNLS